jgi:hypothetical protein
MRGSQGEDNVAHMISAGKAAQGSLNKKYSGNYKSIDGGIDGKQDSE